MSPLDVRNEALYHDRTVQDWHRATFSRDADAIDLDLMGACHRCRGPLYLIEASTNPDKATTILRKLAVRANLPAFLVLHRDGMVIGGRYVSPVRGPRIDEPTLRHALESVRALHRCEHGREACGCSSLGSCNFHAEREWEDNR